jgi:integrase/ribosomal protein L40E
MNVAENNNILYSTSHKEASMRRVEEFLNTQHHLSEGRKQGYREAIQGFDRRANTEFEDIYLNKTKVHATLSALSTPETNSAFEGLEDSTWNQWLICMKRYARWLKDPEDEETPKLWRKIEPKKIDWEEKLKGKWLSEQEFLDLLNVTFNPCHKAMWATGQSGALRACEILGLKVGDAEVQGNEIRVTVSGKTGTRSFVMNQFAPILKHWLNFHPLKHDRNAPLWVRKNLGTKYSLYEPLKYNCINVLFKKYCGLAGIQKPVSLHWLKHTKITWTARNQKIRINDKQANAAFGWSPNSDMFKRYTHLHGTDTDDTFRALEGVETLKEKASSNVNILQSKKCFNCNEQNDASALYCVKCGSPLNEKAALEQSEMKRLNERLLKLMREDKLPK